MEEDDGVDGGGDGENGWLVVDEGMSEEAQKFWYLWDVVNCEAGVEGAAKARVAVA